MKNIRLFHFFWSFTIITLKVKIFMLSTAVLRQSILFSFVSALAQALILIFQEICFIYFDTDSRYEKILSYQKKVDIGGTMFGTIISDYWTKLSICNVFLNHIFIPLYLPTSLLIFSIGVKFSTCQTPGYWRVVITADPPKLCS